MVLEQQDIQMQKKKKKINLDTSLTSFTKTDSKEIIDVNVKCNTIKFLEDNVAYLTLGMGMTF